MASVWAQLAAILTFSALLILVLSPALGSLSDSYRLFVDPSSYADASNIPQLVFGLLQAILGLILFSFIISVLSAALEQLIERIKGGALPYKKSDHILIVNHNAKLPLILNEFNDRAIKLNQPCDVVILLSESELVIDLCDDLDFAQWDHLQIYLRQGNTANYETFKNLSIEQAFGLVILSSAETADTFARDNQNLKTLACLTNEPAFYQHLLDRQRARRPVKCSIELSAETYSKDIALALTKSGHGSLFAVTNPGEVIGSVLSRSIIDIVYYKVYFEILSFSGNNVQFVAPDRFHAAGLSAGTRYEDLLQGFSGGVLAGYSRTDSEGRFNLALCPFGEALLPEDWLIFITDDIAALSFSPPAPSPSHPSSQIRPPRQTTSRRLCLIGSAWPVENLDGFLDEASKRNLHAAHFTFEDVDAYFAPDFVETLHAGDYDNIVINLDDETGFRLTLHLIARCKSDDPFLGKIVTVLSDPEIEGLLNKNTRYRNTVLSHKLAAKYIAQITFQKNLEQFYAELAKPEGVEFNLMDVGSELPPALLTDFTRLRAELAAHRLTFVGSVDADKNMRFGPACLEQATQILILNRIDTVGGPDAAE